MQRETYKQELEGKGSDVKGGSVDKEGVAFLLVAVPVITLFFYFGALPLVGNIVCDFAGFGNCKDFS